MPLELLEYKDCVQPFLIHHSNIRGKVVRLADVTRTILTRHDYPPVVSHLLAELLVIAAMLSANLKGKGILTLQLKGDGPVSFLVVDSTAGGRMRGCAGIAEESKATLRTMKPEQARLAEVLGKGYICITLDQGRGDPYQGIVELSDTTLTETMQGYFTHSEQSQVMMKIAVGRGSETQDWRAGGILLQRVPEEGGTALATGEDDPAEMWQHNVLFAETVKAEELLDPHLPMQQLLYRLFNEDGVWVYDSAPLKARCRCSRKKIAATLASFPHAEIASLAVKGRVNVTCQFCSTDRKFTLKQLAELYTSSL